MQYGTIGMEAKYDLMAEKFKTAFTFLHRTDLARLPEGWIELEDGVRASVQHYTTMAADTLSFETHEKFFDIQYLVEGVELVGVAGRKGLTERIPYEPENDITFYEEPALSGALLLRAGDYAVLAPEDAHKPRCAAGAPAAVKKIVVKVPVETRNASRPGPVKAYLGREALFDRVNDRRLKISGVFAIIIHIINFIR